MERSKFSKLNCEVEQDHNVSAYRTLQFISGLQGFSDTSPTVWVRGDLWPENQEVMTRYPLSGSSELLYMINCIEGRSALSFGLIVPDNRRHHFAGLQNREHLELTGMLWAWNSKSRKIFRRSFNTKNGGVGAGAAVQITCHDCNVTGGSVLSVRCDPKNKTVHFNVNGKEEFVSIRGNELNFCHGYARLTSSGSDSKIEVTIIPSKNKAYFQQNPPSSVELPLANENHDSCWMPVVRGFKRLLADLPGSKEGICEETKEDIPQLCYYELNQNPQGCCLIINNVPNLIPTEEKQISSLFTSLSFEVEIRQNLKRAEIYRVAQEFASKDYRNYGYFVAFVISLCSYDNEICGDDRRKASVEQIMSEFTASNCPSLKKKPKMFFVQKFKMSSSKLENSHDSSMFLPYCDDEAEVLSSPYVLPEGGVCPEEADFLLTCATSQIYEAQQVPESSFIQVLTRVFKNCHHLGYDLLEMLTKVNELLVNETNRTTLAHVSYLTHTLRAKVRLGWTLDPSQEAASAIPGTPLHLNRYEINGNPHGYCIIINNIKFEDKNLHDRVGARKDEESLKKLFTNLRFTVVVKRNLKKHEIERMARTFGEKNHREFGALFFILMSHGGNKDCILGVQGRRTTVETLMVEFQARNCPSLIGKPKVFIIQTCRGLPDHVNETFAASVGSIQSQSVLSTSPSADTQFAGHPLAMDSTLSKSVFPTEADFLLAFATVPGFVSYRFEETGTLFIQDLVEVIREHHHHHHFLDILTEVTKRVVERQNSYPNMEEYPFQVPSPMHTLTKHLYL